MYNVWFDDIN